MKLTTIIAIGASVAVVLNGIGATDQIFEFIVNLLHLHTLSQITPDDIKYTSGTA